MILVLKEADDFHFELFHRYGSQYLTQVYRATSDNGTLNDADGTKLDVRAMEVVYDSLFNSYSTYMLSRSESSVVLQQVLFSGYAPLDIDHFQSRLNVNYSQNCADVLKASENVVIVGCRNNGAFSIFMRDR